jgi:putative tricarboxylic transport membrane protein
MDSERGSAALGSRRSRWPWPLLAPLAVLLLGVGYTVVALRLPLQTALGVGPGFLPSLIGLFIVACAAWALATRATAIPPDQPFPLGEEAGRVPLLLALLVAYLVLLIPLGHLLSGMLMGSASLWVLGRRPWWAAVGIGVALSAGSWALFDLALGLPLPAGPL